MYLEYLGNVGDMVLPSAAVDENIIKEDQNEDTEKWSKNVCHQALKR